MVPFVSDRSAVVSTPAPSRLPDACVCSFPGDAPPVLPHTVTADVADNLRAEYRCPDCRREWKVWWNRTAAGWPTLWSAA